jgi:hypothetical protein
VSTAAPADPPVRSPEASPRPPSTVAPRAVWALVCALCGLACCPLTAPVAWWLGWSEARAVRAGRSVASDSTVATISMWLGVLGTALAVLSVLVVAVATVTMVVLAYRP